MKRKQLIWMGVGKRNLSRRFAYRLFNGRTLTATLTDAMMMLQVKCPVCLPSFLLICTLIAVLPNHEAFHSIINCRRTIKHYMMSAMRHKITFPGDSIRIPDSGTNCNEKRTTDLKLEIPFKLQFKHVSNNTLYQCVWVQRRC